MAQVTISAGKQAEFPQGVNHVVIRDHTGKLLRSVGDGSAFDTNRAQGAITTTLNMQQGYVGAFGPGGKRQWKYKAFAANGAMTRDDAVTVAHFSSSRGKTDPWYMPPGGSILRIEGGTTTRIYDGTLDMGTARDAIELPVITGRSGTFIVLDKHGKEIHRVWYTKLGLANQVIKASNAPKRQPTIPVKPQVPTGFILQYLHANGSWVNMPTTGGYFAKGRKVTLRVMRGATAVVGSFTVTWGTARSAANVSGTISVSALGAIVWKPKLSVAPLTWDTFLETKRSIILAGLQQIINLRGALFGLNGVPDSGLTYGSLPKAVGALKRLASKRPGLRVTEAVQLLELLGKNASVFNLASQQVTASKVLTLEDMRTVQMLAATRGNAGIELSLDGDDKGSLNIDTVFANTVFEYIYTDPTTRATVTLSYPAPPLLSRGPEGAGTKTIRIPKGTDGTLRVITMDNSPPDAGGENVDPLQIGGVWQYSVRDAGLPSFTFNGRPLESIRPGRNVVKLTPPLSDLQSEYLQEFNSARDTILNRLATAVQLVQVGDLANQSPDQAIENAANRYNQITSLLADLRESSNKLATSIKDLERAGISPNWFYTRMKNMQIEIRRRQASLFEGIKTLADTYTARVDVAKKRANQAKTFEILGLVASVIGGVGAVCDIGIGIAKIVKDKYGILNNRKYWFQKSNDNAMLVASERQRVYDGLFADLVEMQTRPISRWPGPTRQAQEANRRNALTQQSRLLTEAKEALDEAAIEFAKKSTKLKETNIKLSQTRDEIGSQVVSVFTTAADAAALYRYFNSPAISMNIPDYIENRAKFDEALNSLKSLFLAVDNEVPRPWERIRGPEYDNLSEKDVSNNQVGPHIEGFVRTRWRVERATFEETGWTYNVWLEGYRS